MEKINDIRVQHTIFDDLHMVIYMSINPMKPLTPLRDVGERR
jgi:hypothetical protein